MDLDKSKKLVKISNWKIVGYFDSSYQAPEQVTMRLHGTALNHPIMGTKEIVSSELVWFNIDSSLAETLNTFYELGTPNTEWVDWLTTQGKTIKDYQFVIGE